MINTKKAVVLMDANLLAWMPGLLDNSNTDKFNLDDEKKAFKELMDLKKNGRIELAISEIHFDPFKHSQLNNRDTLEQVGNYFHKKISLKRNFLIEGSELDLNADKAIEIIHNGQEKQDDPELFVLANFTDASITHVATCDTKLSAKFEHYEKKLNENENLTGYRDFQKRRAQVFTGLPTEVLEDIKSHYL